MKLLLSLLCGLLLGPASPADAADETLDRIARSGRVVLGAHDHAVPLSYVDAMGSHVGYHLDICRRVVRALEQRLGLPALRVVTVPTNRATRLALLDNRTVDIDCAHNPINPRALSQALLSHATMASETWLMTTTDHPALTLDTLAGHTVAITTGDSAIAALRSRVRRSGGGIRESFGRTSPDAFAQLVDGRAHAVMAPAPYLLAHRAQSADPARYRRIDGAVQTEPLGLMFRLGDETLHAVANEVLEGMMKSGELVRLYERWFTQAIPDFPAPVGYPLAEQARRWFAAPGSDVEGL